MKDDKALQEARKRVKKRKTFYRHLMVFGGVSMLIILLNFLFGFRLRMLLIPLVIWGFGLLIHYLVVFGPGDNKILSDEWEDEEVRREYERIKKRKETKKNTPDDGLDLNDPPSEKIPTENTDWNDQDLV